MFCGYLMFIAYKPEQKSSCHVMAHVITHGTLTRTVINSEVVTQMYLKHISSRVLSHFLSINS